MRKLSKTLLSLLLIAAMLASFVVLPAAAEEPAAEQPTEAVQAAETQADDAVKTNYELSVVMLDCGRKYFSVDSIKQIIDMLPRQASAISCWASATTVCASCWTI